MHDLNAAALQEGGRARALCSSTNLHTADTDWTNKCHSASHNCLLTFAGVSPATLLQVAEIHYPLLKEFFSNLHLFWLAQTSALGTWNLERICFLHITGTAHTAFRVP